MPRYAHDTSVSVEKSKVEIEQIVRRAGINDAELVRLKEIAHKATPGPWRVGTSKGPHSPHQDLIRPCGGDWAENIAHGVRVPNAIYMATFDPPTILALIDELEKAREAGGKLVKLAEREPTP